MGFGWGCEGFHGGSKNIKMIIINRSWVSEGPWLEALEAWWGLCTCHSSRKVFISLWDMFKFIGIFKWKTPLKHLWYFGQHPPNQGWTKEWHTSTD